MRPHCLSLENRFLPITAIHEVVIAPVYSIRSFLVMPRRLRDQRMTANYLASPLYLRRNPLQFGRRSERERLCAEPDPLIRTHGFLLLDSLLPDFPSRLTK
jgi:hypothetical protein